MNQSDLQAIHLLLEDLQTSHHEIRIVAKKLNCEKELEKYKNNLIEHLQQILNYNSNKIKELEFTIKEMNKHLLHLNAKLSRLKNPDYPQYTDEELDAMFEYARND